MVSTEPAAGHAGEVILQATPVSSLHPKLSACEACSSPDRLFAALGIAKEGMASAHGLCRPSAPEGAGACVRMPSLVRSNQPAGRARSPACGLASTPEGPRWRCRKTARSVEEVLLLIHRD